MADCCLCNSVTELHIGLCDYCHALDLYSYHLASVEQVTRWQQTIFTDNFLYSEIGSLLYYHRQKLAEYKEYVSFLHNTKQRS